MHTRAITRADVPAVGVISTDAFMDDEMNEYLWPHRKQHAEDYGRRLANNARTMLVAPGTYGCVAVADEKDAERLPGVAHGTVLGFAWWIRQGASKKYQGRRSAIVDDEAAIANEKRSVAFNTGVGLALERTLLGMEDLYGRVVSPDPSACSAADMKAVRSGFNLEPLFEKLPGVWYLRLIGTGPQYQRKGVAGALVEWGMAKAQEEGIPCAMTSSDIGQAVYERYGFKVVLWNEMPVSKGWRGGATLVWDPWRIWVDGFPQGEATWRGRRITGKVKGLEIID